MYNEFRLISIPFTIPFPVLLLKFWCMDVCEHEVYPGARLGPLLRTVYFTSVPDCYNFLSHFLRVVGSIK